jgi:hypothetical protein
MTAVPIQIPYQTRPVRFLELWNCDGWQVKVYGIAYQRPAPRPELVRAAKQVAQDRLPQPPATGERAGVAILIVHDALGSIWALVEWWEGNVLHNHVYGGHPATPSSLAPVTGGPMACTYELAVIGFERQAWLNHVLAGPKPDLGAYLGARLHGDV